ncbi:Tn3 family transposase [Pseudovibrio sp. POLY-S9]|uniref:Tn3 family transposase n=1 Tax=Pseudovibrio sp. POLY-S9 TaxID=1576596 RepID=UPI00070FA202|nr:Tn3 family transposase [Pseudovibrio sp. POLY-S9]
MAHRTVLTKRQRDALFALPTDRASLEYHYTLADDDIAYIKTRRRPKNQMGFALQLCALRYPGRLLKPGEVIPEAVSSYLAAQLGLQPEDLLPYAARDVTRREHLSALRKIYGYQRFTGKRVKQMKSWLSQQAEAAESSEGLVCKFVEECRKRKIILPGVTTIERLCADALVAAERRIEDRIVTRLESRMRRRLNDLLGPAANGWQSVFLWLRSFEVGKNTADMNRLLERVEFLKEIGLSPDVLDGIPPHRVKILRRQGERYFTADLQDISSNRRLAILATCVVEWAASIADTVVETHDRIVSKTWREAKKISALHFEQAQADIASTLAEFQALGTTLLMARGDDLALGEAIDASCSWAGLETLVAMATQLIKPAMAEPMDHIEKAVHSFKLYGKRMLSVLDIRGATVVQPLLDAAAIIREGADIPTKSRAFLPARSKWDKQLRKPDTNEERLWIVAVMFRLQEAFRSNDIWLDHARRYADDRKVLVPLETAKTMPGLDLPLDPRVWIEDRKRRLEDGFERLAAAVRDGALPNGIIEDGQLRIERLKADVPEEAADLVLDLYRRLPPAKITDILQDVAEVTGFTEAFTHLRTGTPCKDIIGLLTVLLGEGLNVGLSKMAAATADHEYSQLSRLSRWFVENDAINEALAIVLDAQSKLPMAQYWGSGQTSSSDGQFFPTTRQGEAMNLINTKYDAHVPGLKAYTHVSDLYGPYWINSIPATVSEAPYILDGLCLSEIGKKIKEHYADTGGFTDLIFATFALLGYRFIPRIRDLKSKRFYVFDLKSVPKELKCLIGGKVREQTFIDNWGDVLRCTATMRAGKVPPSQILKRLSARPRKNDLAIAMREIGQIERTLFVIEWALDMDMQRRSTVGLNKGEAHHALKNALWIGRQGEIRDRTTESQHFRLACLNLLTAIIIFWNTDQLGNAVLQRQSAGLDTPEFLLRHISPLGWEHILLIGQYIWRKRKAEIA